MAAAASPMRVMRSTASLSWTSGCGQSFDDYLAGQRARECRAAPSIGHANSAARADPRPLAPARSGGDCACAAPNCRATWRLPSRRFGAAHHRARAGQARFFRSSTSACSINSIGAIGRTGEASAIIRLGPPGIAPNVAPLARPSPPKQDILQPQAVYGFWKCAADGNDVILFDEDGTVRGRALHLPAPEQGGRSLHRRFLPRCRRPATRCHRAADGDDRAARLRGGARWFAQDRYQDYLYLHGLSVELAEAMAELSPQKDPRRIRLRRRSGARPRRHARAKAIAAAAIPSAIRRVPI